MRSLHVRQQSAKDAAVRRRLDDCSEPGAGGGDEEDVVGVDINEGDPDPCASGAEAE